MSPSVCNPATLIAYLVLCRLTMDFVNDVHTCQIGYHIYSNGRRTPFSSHPRINATFNYIHDTVGVCGNESMRAHVR